MVLALEGKDKKPKVNEYIVFESTVKDLLTKAAPWIKKPEEPTKPEQTKPEKP